MSSWLHGEYELVNRNKCVNTNKLIYRSSWEKKKMMYWCDHNINVIEWGSEVITIPYINDVDGRPHKYITDFYVSLKDINGIVKRKILEIKPSKQVANVDESGNLILPKPPKKKTQKAMQNYNNSVNEIIKNHSKWKYAREFCKQYNMEFLVITEKEIFNGNR